MTTTVQTERGTLSYSVPPGAPIAAVVEQLAPRERPYTGCIGMSIHWRDEDLVECVCAPWIPCYCEPQRRATAGGNSGPKPRGPK